MLKAETAFAKVDLARDTGIDHPLQCSVDCRATDALILAPDQIDQVIGAEMPFLTQKDVEDEIPFARAFGPSGTNTIEIGGGHRHDS